MGSGRNKYERNVIKQRANVGRWWSVLEGDVADRRPAIRRCTGVLKHRIASALSAHLGYTVMHVSCLPFMQTFDIYFSYFCFTECIIKYRVNVSRDLCPKGEGC